MITALAVAAVLTACNSESENDGTYARITFTVTGDFALTTSPMTRVLEADGKSMTDVWVLDYIDGVLKQQVHQTSDDSDFGSPTLSLALGEHHIYFIASRGQDAALDTDAHTITFSTVRDTFWKDYPITVSGGTSSGSRSVALDRAVTKLKVTFSDAIPEDAATFNISPATWYYGMDYMTGNPTAAATSQAITVSIPASSIGVTGENVSIFGFSGSEEWATDISVDCKTAGGSVLGAATIASAPFVRNRVNEYTGPMFGDNGAMTLTLNAAWEDAYTGTW